MLLDFPDIRMPEGGTRKLALRHFLARMYPETAPDEPDRRDGSPALRPPREPPGEQRAAPARLAEFKPALLVLDVRSPAEYARGCIPGAISLPLFDDEQRALVGTCFKRKGRLAAIELGLQLTGEDGGGSLLMPRPDPRPRPRLPRRLLMRRSQDG